MAVSAVGGKGSITLDLAVEGAFEFMWKRGFAYADIRFSRFIYFYQG